VVVIKSEQSGKTIVTATRIKVLIDGTVDTSKFDKLRVDGALLPLDALPALNSSPANEPHTEDSLAKAIDSSVGKIADALYPRPLWLKAKNGGDILAAQLKALKWLRERGYANVSLLIPSIHSARDVIDARILAEKIGLQKKGLNLGAFIDTPAMTFLPDELAHAGVSFACIDADSLSQKMLADDAARFFGTLHPSVAKAVEHTTRCFRRHKVPVAILSTKANPHDSLDKFVRARPDALVLAMEHLPVSTYLIARFERLLELEFRKDWVVKRI